MSGLDTARLERIRTHFDRYVDYGRLPGYFVQIARDGELAYEAAGGRRDLEAGLPVEPDTLWRIYSMTKPITSVAAMLLLEEGTFELKDPIARWLPPANTRESANAGMNFATGSLSSKAPSSHSIIAATEVIGLVIE